MDVLLKTLRTDGPTAFAFLVADHGFSAPESIDDGLRYSRPELTVEISVWTWKHETEFATMLYASAGNGGRSASALSDLYVQQGHGPAQDVGHSATSGHTVRKRIREHARALATVLADPAFPDAIRRN